MFFDGLKEKRTVSHVVEDIHNVIEVLDGYHDNQYIYIPTSHGDMLYEVQVEGDTVNFRHSHYGKHLQFSPSNSLEEINRGIISYSKEVMGKGTEEIRLFYKKYVNVLNSSLTPTGLYAKNVDREKYYTGQIDIYLPDHTLIMSIDIEGKVVVGYQVHRGKHIQLHESYVKVPIPLRMTTRKSIDSLIGVIKEYMQNTSGNVREIERYIIDLTDLRGDSKVENIDYAKYLLGMGRHIKGTSHVKIGRLKLESSGTLVGVAELGVGTDYNVYIVSRLSNQTNDKNGNIVALSKNGLTLQDYIENYL